MHQNLGRQMNLSLSEIIIDEPAISPDGLFVGFRSDADDPVAGDTNNSLDTESIEIASKNSWCHPSNGCTAFLWAARWPPPNPPDVDS